MNRIPTWLQLFWACFIQSGLVTINYRAIAQARLVETFVSDLCLFLFGFFIVKKVVEAKGFRDAFCYALGGSCGSVLCVLITKYFFGQ